MSDLADLETQKAQLLKARLNPVKSVQHGDKSVTNRSVTELRAQASDLNKEIARAGGKRRNRQLRFVTNRGL